MDLSCVFAGIAILCLICYVVYGFGRVRGYNEREREEKEKNDIHGL